MLCMLYIFIDFVCLSIVYNYDFVNALLTGGSKGNNNNNNINLTP